MTRGGKMRTVLSVLLLFSPPVVVSSFLHAMAADFECFDERGRPVGLIEDDHLDQIDRAAVDPVGGEALIYYNPGLLTWIHPATRLFFLGHECAHHRLGHPLGGGLTGGLESAADCWAVRELTRTGRLTDEDLVSVQKDLYTFGKEEWASVPGPRRGINPKDCSR